MPLEKRILVGGSFCVKAFLVVSLITAEAQRVQTCHLICKKCALIKLKHRRLKEEFLGAFEV